MKRFSLFLAGFFLIAATQSAFAGSSAGSLEVSVVVLPSKTARLNAPVPVNGLQRMENDVGEHWVVEASASQALAAYRAQLSAAGYTPSDAAALLWKKGSEAVMISAHDAISTRPISRLDALAFRTNIPRYTDPRAAQVGVALASLD